MIINELVSNSLKYAFPLSFKSSGEIKIYLHPHMSDMAELIVQDNGVGLPKDIDIHKTESLGMQLIIILTNQIGGKLLVKRRSGTKFIIRFKL
ncbi:sensor histidine kinase [bacterium]|nr:sensor histidine kinase [bacterium]